jgi:hypothetical protein
MTRRERFIYNDTLESENVSISYLEDQNHISTFVPQVKDLSKQIPGNAFIQNFNKEYLSNTVDGDGIVEIRWPSTKIRLTNIFNTQDSLFYLSDNPIALYFVHLLPNDLFFKDANQILDVEILDKNFKKVNNTPKYLDINSKVFYSNLENTFNKNDLTFDCYFLKISYKQNDQIFSIITLLNNHKVADLTEERTNHTESILNKPLIISRFEDNIYEFGITHDDYVSFFFERDPVFNIKPFIFKDQTESWYVAFSGGKFSISKPVTDFKEDFSIFFEKNPSYSKIQVINEKAQILSKNLIQLNTHGRLYPTVDTSGINDTYVRILIHDENNNPLYALSSFSNDEGDLASNGKNYLYYNPLVNQNSVIGIAGYDEKNAIIQITGIDLDSSYKIYASYWYCKNFLTLSDFSLPEIEFNPFLNPSILDEEHSFHLTGKYSQYPFAISSATLSTAINQDLYNSISLPLPLADVTYSLGSVSIKSNKNFDSYDIRLSAEKIAENQIDSVLPKNKEIINYTDNGFFDGIPYPGNASTFIELPAELQEKFGGQFTAEEIDAIVKNHLALGVYPIVKFYGPEIQISDIETTTTSINIEWETSYSEDLVVEYNIYISYNPNGPWVGLNNPPFSQNTYLINSLLQNTQYYVKIEPGYHNSDGEWIIFDEAVETLSIKTLVE